MVEKINMSYPNNVSPWAAGPLRGPALVAFTSDFPEPLSATSVIKTSLTEPQPLARPAFPTHACKKHRDTPDD